MSWEAREAKLTARLKSRTDRDGKPRKGYEQNVAVIRAELEILRERRAKCEGINSED